MGHFMRMLHFLLKFTQKMYIFIALISIPSVAASCNLILWLLTDVLQNAQQWQITSWKMKDVL